MANRKDIEEKRISFLRLSETQLLVNSETLFNFLKDEDYRVDYSEDGSGLSIENPHAVGKITIIKKGK